MSDPAKDAERIEHMARCLKDAWDNRSSYHPGPRDVATLKRVNRQLASQAERVRELEPYKAAWDRALIVYSGMKPGPERHRLAQALNMGAPKSSRPKVNVAEFVATPIPASPVQEGEP